MRIPFVAGNWKMNLSVAEAVKFLQDIKGKLPDPKITETCIAASPLFLESMIKENGDSPLIISAENVLTF